MHQRTVERHETVGRHEQAAPEERDGQAASEKFRQVATPRSARRRSGVLGPAFVFGSWWVAGAMTVAACAGDTTQSSSEPEQDPLGEPCDSDGTCPAGASCVRLGVDGGESQTGICSLPCDDSDDCGMGAVCEVVAGRSLCLKLCDGPEPLDTYCGAKLTCAGDAGQPVCRPQCTSDADCTAGSCNNQTGLCASDDSSVLVDDVGEACDPGAASCKSFCLDLADDYAVCSARCSVGNACPDDYSVCVNDTDPGRAGIAGSCVELCTQERGCRDPLATCDAFAEREWLAILYSNIYDGLCLRMGYAAHVGAPGE